MLPSHLTCQDHILALPCHLNLRVSCLCPEETVLNSLARDLPSASVVAGYPKEFSKFLERFPIHMHRPCHDCTIPLTAMRREFGQFQEDYHVANPIPEDCKFARQFCETVSKVAALALSPGRATGGLENQLHWHAKDKVKTVKLIGSCSMTCVQITQACAFHSFWVQRTAKNQQLYPLLVEK